MQVDPKTLEGLPRDQLIERARRAGVRRPELLTRVELKDEIVRLSEPDESKRRAARGWLGVARDLLASVVEQGLHMPDAAKLIRGEPLLGDVSMTQAPVATVTLAEIYVAQGHMRRALSILDEVLVREPEHEAARALRDRLVAESERDSQLPSAPGSASEPADASANGAKAEAATAPEVKLDHAAEPAQKTKGSVAAIPAPPHQPSPPIARGPADVVVTIAEAPGRLYVYWELGERSLRRARRQHPDGRAVIRLVELRPSWSGAARVERELDVDVPSGSQHVAADENALVRAAIGWRSPAGFMPFAVGSELTAPSPAHGNGAGALSPAQHRALDRYRGVAK